MKFERQRDSVILGYEQSDSAAYARTNVAIVDEALRIAQQERKLAQALVVWDEKSRGADSGCTRQPYDSRVGL